MRASLLGRTIVLACLMPANQFSAGASHPI